MNTLQIRDLLSCTPNVQVCASNELKFIDMPFYAVVNSENSQSDGLHWLALAFIKKDLKVTCCYFDSLGGGLHAMVPDIKDFIFQHADVLQVNSRRAQSLSSSVCGLYCVFFVICMQNNIKYHDFLLQFQDNAELNDDRIFTTFYSALKKLGAKTSKSKVMTCKALT